MNGWVEFVQAPIDCTGAGDHLIATGQEGSILAVIRYLVIATGAVTVTFKSSSGVAIAGPLPLMGLGHGILDTEPIDYVLETRVGEGLILNLSADVTIGGYMSYRRA